MGFIKDLGMQVAGGALGGIMGMAFGNANDKRQLEQQRKLQEMQIAGQKDMSSWQKALDLQMWKDTSYPAQMEMMKKAGLNPALMYGMSGGGGTTVGSPGPHVQGATASGHQGEMISMTGMGLQLGMMQAQKDLLESQAKKNNAETEKLSGTDTQESQTRIKSLLQGIENQKAQEGLTKVEQRLKEIDVQVQGDTAEERIDYIVWNSLRALEELDQVSRETYIKKATMNDKIDIVKREAIGALLRNQLTGTEIKANETQIKVNEAQINKWATELTQGWHNLSRQDQELRLKTWEAEIKAQFPGIGQMAGKIINDVMEGAKTILDGKDAHKRRTYDSPIK